MACSASHNPHQFGFEFDQSHVAHSRKVIPSRLPRFEYEYRFAEYRPPRRTEYEYYEIQCEARSSCRSTRIDQVRGGDFTQAKTDPQILLTRQSSFRVFGVFRGCILNLLVADHRREFLPPNTRNTRKKHLLVTEGNFVGAAEGERSNAFKWTSRRRAFGQTPCGLVYKPTGRVPFDCGSLGDAQGSSGSSQARQTLEVPIWKRD